jgi:hypothetical protein
MLLLGAELITPTPVRRIGRRVRAAGAVLKMPVARYFGFVGGVLLALLLVLNALLPVPPDAGVDSSVDKSTIRIRSDHKWPEPIVLDTTQRVVAPAQTANRPETEPGQPTLADVTGKVRARDSLAELQSPEKNNLRSSQVKKPEKKPVHKRRIARRHPPPGMMIAQQPQFGFFGNTAWSNTW